MLISSVSIGNSVFDKLIWHTKELHSSLFGPDGTVNYDYIVTNSLKPGSQYDASIALCQLRCDKSSKN